MNPAELRYGAKIRLVPRCQHAESNVFGQPLLQTTRRENAHAIAVNQNLGHHPGVIRRIAALLALVVALDRVQVQLIDQVGDEIRQVVLGQPLTQTRRKKKILLRKIRPVNLRHTPRLAASPPAIQALSCTNFALLRRAPSLDTIPVIDNEEFVSDISVQGGNTTVIVSNLSRTETRTAQGFINFIPTDNARNHQTSELVVTITPVITRETLEP